MSATGDGTVTVEFARDEYKRLSAVTDDPRELVHEAAMGRVELEEAIAYTRDGDFHGPNGFAKLMDDDLPTWPLGSLLGIELRSMGDGRSRWTLEAGGSTRIRWAPCTAACSATSATRP